MKIKEQELVKILLASDDYLAAKEITAKMGISTKTVYNYLNQIEADLADYDLKVLKIPRKGVKIEGSTEAKAKLRIDLQNCLRKTASRYIPEFRKLYLLSQILFRDFLDRDIELLAQKFYISPQSIKNDLEELVMVCETHRLSINKSKGKYTIGGSEVEIQQAYREYFESILEQHEITTAQEEELFSTATIKIVDEFLKELVESEETETLTAYMTHSLRVNALILIQRVNSDHHVDVQRELVFQQIEKLQLYMTALELADRSSRFLGAIFTQQDVEYLSYLLLVHGVQPINHEADVNEEIQITVRQIIQQMSQLIGTDLTQDHYLFQSLLSHIVPMIYRLQIGIDIKNPLRNEIIRQYSTMYTLTSYCVTDLETDYQIRLNSDELTFLTIHFQLAFEKVTTVQHILIVCPSGLGTSQLLYQKIQRLLPQNHILEIVELPKLSQLDLDKVDLVVSTVKIPRLAIPTIYVSPLPSDSELQAVITKTTQIESKQKAFTYPASIAEDSEELLDEDYFFIDMDLSSQEAVLAFFADLYLERGLADRRFKEKLIEQEAMGTTGLSTGVAIPHADPETVKKTKIAFMTLKQPIVWGQNKVKLVILLAIANSEMDQAKQIIASIYGLLDSKERVDQLVKANEKSEIIEILRKSGRGTE